MLEASFFGYSYRILDIAQLETLRLWRTDKELQPFMRFRQMITPEQQLAWFHKLADTPEDLHLIVWKDSLPIAYLATKQISSDPFYHEISLILGEKSLRGSPTTLTSVIFLLLLQHGLLKVDAVVATVLKDNLRVLQMLHSLGFVSEEEHTDHFRLFCRVNDFMDRCPRFIEGLKQISSLTPELTIDNDKKYKWVVRSPNLALFHNIGVELKILSS